MIDPAIRRGARLELARREFWEYCKLMAPDFYREDRPHLKKLCSRLQAFCESDRKVMVINMPPRHGKSRTAVLLSQWLFGRDPSEQIMTGSYNETLSTTFARSVRDGIAEEKFDPNRIVFSDIFPNTRIKYGEAAAGKWALEGQYASYLATSPGGTATGFGASILIIDDLIKKAEEAFNENVLEKQWQWFTDTMLSRTETGYKIIIIMTRWATNDLAGRALQHWPDAEHITMKAMQDDDTMLCDAVLTREDYADKVRAMSPEIASANYQQEPIDIKGRLYSRFKTYDDVPRDAQGRPLFTAINNYTDTADTGSDYLCSITYGAYNHEAYVLDVYYTKAPMEVTEPETAKRLVEAGCGHALIESNNGGRGFARNVGRELDALGSNRCRVEWFHQSENKTARIMTNATWVQDHIYFPVNWRDRWPEYFDAMVKYQREGKNAHDDAPDATTGVAEQMTGKRQLVIPKTTMPAQKSYWRR